MYSMILSPKIIPSDDGSDREPAPQMPQKLTDDPHIDLIDAAILNLEAKSD